MQDSTETPPAGNDPRASGKPVEIKPIGFGGRLRAYLFAGIVITAPISITFYLAWLFVTFVDSKVTPLIPAVYNPATYLPFAIPGLGLVVVIVALTLIGAVSAGLFGRLLVRFYESLLGRMPVLRSIYGATKQIIETVLAHQSTAFREAVLVEYPRKGIWCIGFLTGVTRGEVQKLTDEEVLNVFLPTTPNPTSGFLLFVPRRDLVVLDMSVEEALKMVISGGIVTPPHGPAEGGAAVASARTGAPASPRHADRAADDRGVTIS